jgi:hypothetical protein
MTTMTIDEQISALEAEKANLLRYRCEPSAPHASELNASLAKLDAQIIGLKQMGALE